MTDQPEPEGWTHELWEHSHYETAARWKRHGGKHDPTLARLTIEGDAVTLCFRDKVRFHDECEYRFLRFKPGWPLSLSKASRGRRLAFLQARLARFASRIEGPSGAVRARGFRLDRPIMPSGEASLKAPRSPPIF